MNLETAPLVTIPRPLTKFEKFGYGIGHMHNDLSAGMWFSYALIYFQIITNRETLIPGFLVLTGQLVDAFITPVAGYFLDKTENKRKWHLIASIFSCVSFPLIFVSCSLCYDNKIYAVTYHVIMISIYQCAWAFVQISHLAILPEMTNSCKERSELTSYRYSAAMGANTILYSIAWVFFSGSDGGGNTLLNENDSMRFLGIAVTITLVGIVTAGIFHSLIKYHRRSTSTNDIAFKASFAIRKMCSSYEIYVVAAVYTSSRLFLNLTMGFIQLYMNETIISFKEAIGIVPLIMFISSALASLGYKYILEFVGGHKWTYVFGWLTSLTGCAIILFRTERSDNINDIIISAIFFGIGSSLLVIVSLSLAASLVKIKGTGGFIYSTVTFSDKAINGFAIMLIEYLKCDDGLCTMYYRDILVYVNGTIVTIGLFFALFSPRECELREHLMH